VSPVVQGGLLEEQAVFPVVQGGLLEEQAVSPVLKEGLRDEQAVSPVAAVSVRPASRSPVLALLPEVALRELLPGMNAGAPKVILARSPPSGGLLRNSQMDARL
jgi:hypothetical protein